MNLQEIASQLRERRIVHHRMLKSGGLAEIEAALDGWSAQGKDGFVLVVPPRQPLEAYLGVAQEMGLDESKELLLLFDGRSWKAKGWGLSAAKLSDVLDKARPFLRPYWGRGLVKALDLAGEAATGKKRGPTQETDGGSGLSERPSDSSFSWIWPVAGVAAGGVLWVYWRRRGQAKERNEEVEQLLESTRLRFADVMMASDALPHEIGEEVQLEAARINDQIERLAGSLSSGDDSRLTRAKLDQLNNELVALDSRVMAERHKGRGT